MKILHIIPDLALTSGGPVAVVLNAVKAMIHLGHEVSIGTTDHGFQHENCLIDSEQLILSRCDFKKWRWSRRMRHKLIPAIRKADLIHLHGVWEYPIWLGTQICVQLGKPYVLRPCGMLEWWSMRQNRWRKQIYLKLFGKVVIDHASAVHFTSEQEKTKSLPAIGEIVPHFVCPLGVDDSLFGALPSASFFRKHFSGIGDDRIILFLGRIHPKKQPDLLIRAFRSILDRHPNSCLVIAGPGDDNYVASLKRLVSALQIGQKVIFTGMLTGDAKKEALAAADIFALPSLQENFGIAVAEAMAAGCPVVVSDAVDLAEDVQRSHTGVVCQGAVEAFFASLDQLLSDESLRRQMGANGRKLASEKYDWSKIAALLLGKYEVIIRNRKGIE